MAEENTPGQTPATVDLSKLSDSDLDFYSQGNYAAMSSRGVRIVSGEDPEGLKASLFSAASNAAGAAATAGRDIYDWTRGAKVTYPQLPILGQGLGVRDLNLPAADQARLMALVGTTLDPARLERGIVEIMPNAQTSRDTFGNVLVSVPVKDPQGKLLGFSTFYPNPRGLDMPTALQLSGAVAAAPLIETGLGAIGVPTTLGMKSTAIAATEAATAEGLSAMSSGDPMAGRPVAEGAIFGSAFYGLGQIFKGIGGKLGSLFETAPARVIDRNAKLTPEAVSYLRSVGIDPEQVQVNVFEDIAKRIREGAVPEEALAKMQAQGLPVRVDLTSGQITGDMEQQLFEDLAQKGVYGEKAKDIIRAQFDAQDAAVRENIDEIQRIIAGGGPVVGRTEGGAAVQAALVNARAAAKENADQMYQQARSAGAAYADPAQAATFGAEIIAGLKTNFNPRSAPTTYGILGDLDEIFQNGGSLDDIQAVRSQLTSQAANLGSEGAAARQAVEQLDQKLFDMAEHNLFYGNNEAVGLWSSAIKNYRGFKNLWDSQGGILNSLTKEGMIDGSKTLIVAPQAAAKAILGSTFSGLIGKPEAIRTLTTLKNTLPAAEWDLLRQEAFMMISDGIVSNATGRVANTFSREWADAQRRNPELVRTLFTGEERKVMNSLASTTARMMRTEKNRSNSGAVVGSMLGSLFRMMGRTDVARAAGEWFLVNGVQRSYGVSRALSAAEGALQTTPTTLDRLVLGGGVGFGATPDQPDEQAPPPPAIPPQARVQPPTAPTRGVPGLDKPAGPAGGQASAPAQPGASREMLRQLFPFDPLVA